MGAPGPLDQNIAEIAIWTILFSCLYWLLYRRRFVSIADPLIVFLITQIFSSVLIVVLVQDSRMKIQFFLAEFAFWIGFMLCRTHRHEVRLKTTNAEIQIAETTIFILFIVWLAVSLYAGLSVGFPLLAGNPSLSKTVVYTGGFGIAKRMNEGMGVLVPVGAFLLAFRGKHKRLFSAIVIVSILLSILSGSKGALLTFIYIVGYILAKDGAIGDLQRLSLRKLLPVLIAMGGAFAILVLLMGSSGLAGAFNALALRLVFYGDIVIYYYQSEIFRHFSHLGIWQFVQDTLNPMLGEFRIVPYLPPMGINIIGYSSAYADFSGTTGPNTLFFASANIYFGLFGGALYSAAMGWTVVKVRGWYLSAKTASIIELICMITLAIEIFALPTESPLFVSVLADTFVPFAIVLVVVKITCYAVKNDPSQVMRTRAG